MSHELIEALGINSFLQQTPIAIIGLASIFPKSKNIQQYWDNIVKEVDCVTDVPPSRWNSDDYFDPDPRTPDKTYCKRGGFIPDIDFNPMEFGLPPNILELTDVSQLLSLVVAKEALKDAGYENAGAAMRERTGVILGVGGGQKLITPLTTRLQYPVWERVLKSSGIAPEDRQKIIEKMKLAYIPWEENSFPGMLGNVIAGRVANRLDLGGTNCVVDAACAASLAAVKMAVSDLIEHRADAMITGGVDTDNSIFMYLSFSKTPAFSRQQDIRPFDENSDGMMIGEGVGMLVLKRLSDAQRDNDRIYAVIKGIGTASDGKYKSIYAPRASGQSLAVSRAYKDAGIAPATVGLVEAHGTGTSAGDPTEFEGLREVFSQKNPKKQHIALGSVKSQIGHTKAAAGAASLIKTALALHHKILPPTLNVANPNPKLDIENSPFYLNTQTRPWIQSSDGTPRRAGVSAFGFGGTNFHFVLEEHTGDHLQAYRLHSTPAAIFLSAPTPVHLLNNCREQLAQLQSETGEQQYAALVESSKSATIPASSARVGFVTASLPETIEFLQIAVSLLGKNGSAEQWEHPRGIYYRKSGMETGGKVVALFPGQGSQYLEMGKELALNFPSIRQAFSQIDGLFITDHQPPLSTTVFPPPVFNPADRAQQSKKLEQTEFAQPAIGVFSLGLYKLLQQVGFSPDFVAGHSFGELTALWAGGVLNDEDYFYLIKARGQAMAPPTVPNFDAGTMLAVKGDAEQLQAEAQKLPDVTIANLNSNQQVILAGPRAAMARAQQHLQATGFGVTPLPVSAAFHTPLVAHAQHPFALAIERTTFNTPAIPVYTNSTGQPYPSDPKAIKVSLEEHILKPVLFKQEIENIYAAGGTIFVEIGPRSVLTNLVKNILGDKPHLAVSLNASQRKSSDNQLRDAFVQLCVAGLSLRTVDPYQVERVANISAKKPLMTVKLSGNNYVSDKTKAAFETALKDGHVATITPPATPAPVQAEQYGRPNGKQHEAATQKPVTIFKTEPSPVKPVTIPSTPTIITVKPAETRTRPPEPRPVPLSSKMVPNGQAEITPRGQSRENMNMKSQPSPATGAPSGAPERLEQSINLLHQHQAETLRAHEAYLKNQDAYSKSLFELLRRHNSGAPLPAHVEPVEAELPTPPAQLPAEPAKVIAPTPSPPAASAIAKTPTPPAQLPAEPAVAELPVEPAEAIAPTPPPPAASIAVVTSAAPAVEIAELSQAMLGVVSEKTGYPAEMLELEMDMEADLGIDSIKRVEILGAMQERYPNLPAVNPEELAELRTLGQIVDHMQGASPAGPTQAPIPAQSKAAVTTLTPPAPVVNEHAPAIAVGELSQAMLGVVSEKTGYPAEMLELEMDMEADLGIDSIKRVEILGAMQERYPNLPAVNPEELAELRTLGQIVDHMQGASPAGPTQAPIPAQSKAAVTTLTPPAPVVNEHAPAIAVGELSQAMLGVVSEKTGYPAEMLELEMDMEADLGIDSIKRVEILGAMQERYPNLPAVNPEELAELRTLGQIVDHMQGASPAGPTQAPIPAQSKAAVTTLTPPAPVVNGHAPAIAVGELSQAMLGVVSEKTGYPAEMLELEMDMEADLGIDSIKRVEILGAMQERYPNLPAVNPEELAELRTLGGIVDRLGKFEPAVAEAGGAHITHDETAAVVPAEHSILRHQVALKALPAPDYLEFALPGHHVCLLTDDGTENTTHLSQLLLERGWPLVVLSFPQTAIAARAQLPPGITRFTLADFSEAHLQQQLAEISTTIGPVGAFIHLNPPPVYGEHAGAAKAIVRHLFFIAKHLKAPLDDAARQGRACFMTVARLDGEFGLSGEINFEPIDGGLFGLTKTMNLEWPQVFCRAIDLHPGLDPVLTAQAVVAELHDPNRLITEVGYGRQGRGTLVARHHVADNSRLAIQTPNPITSTSVFVISGGAKGITAQCVIRLAQQHHCRFVLLGRSAIDGVDTNWVGDYDGEAALKRLVMEHLKATGQKPTPVAVQKLARTIKSKQEIEGTLRAIRQAGGQAEYLSVDVTNAPALQTALSAVASRMGTVTGIIHGAGVLSDKLIEKKSEQDFEAVYSTKVEGLQALLAAVPPQQLEQLVIFSSAAGFYGNVGQADYALANDILNKTAWLVKQQYPACHVVSINWGPWDGGMVTPALKKLFAERNIEVIPVDVGTRILVDELSPANHGVVQTVVGGPLFLGVENQDSILRSHRIHRMLSLEANPFLQDHVIGGHPVLPTVCAIAWMSNLCEQLYPGFHLFSCDNYQVLKGIVFDDPTTPAKQYLLDIEETEKSADSVSLKTLVWSTTPDGKPRYHYRAEVTLMQTLPAAPLYPDVDGTESRPIPGTELYQNDTLFHGPAFQGVERVLNISPEKVTMRCVLPEISPARQGQFQVQHFNPFIADGQFQSLVIWARHFHQAGSLPLRAGRGEQYRPIPFGETTYVSMVAKASSDTRLVADIITHDAAGLVYARVLDAEVTISKQLNHLFEKTDPEGLNNP
jgi:acyl transferase domain-containing protein